MKTFAKILSLVLTLSILLSVVSFGGINVSAVENEVIVVLNGETLSFDVPGRLIGGRTMVPLRGIFEALGATVEWDGPTQTVTSTRGDDTVKLTIGKSELYKNDKLHYTMDVVPVIIEEAGASRTLVPVRAVAESFGCVVDWDGTTRTAILTSESDMLLADANGAYYNVVYEEALEDAILGEINSGANVIRYGIGQNMKILADSTAAAAGEIVIGNANRPGSAELVQELLPGNYAIKADPAEKRVYIAGGTLADLCDAINYFFNTYANTETKEFIVPSTLDYKKNETAYVGEHAVFYGKSLLDTVTASGSKTPVLEYDSENEQIYTKIEAYPKSRPQVLFSQRKLGINIFSYNYYVVKYFQNYETTDLNTSVTANVASAKAVYPDYTETSYERTEAKYPAGSNGEWKVAVITRELLNNAPDYAIPHPDMTSQNLRFKPWTAAALEGTYFAVEFVAFFENEDDALEFSHSLEKLHYADVAATEFKLMSSGKEVTEIDAIVGQDVDMKLYTEPSTAVANVEAKFDKTGIVKFINGTLVAEGAGTVNVTFTANKGVEGANEITKTIKVNVAGKRFDSVKISGVDIKDYQIVIGDNADRTEKYAAYNLADYLTVHLGTAPKVVTDKEAEAKYEILVGNTNRSASNTGVAMSGTEFVLVKTGDKVVMQGNGIYVGSAVGDFINTYLEAQGANADITNLPTTATKKPTPAFGDNYENVILMIGDGMGFNHINASLANGLDRFVAQELPVKGKATTYSYNSSVTDSSASATALATGNKTKNGMIGMAPNGSIVKNVRELATEFGAQTAVVTNDSITGATPGGFLVHNSYRGNTTEIKADIDKLVAIDGVDFVAGSVGKNLTSVARQAFRIVSDTDAPFFILIEETSTDSAGHNNDMVKLIEATTRIDDAITYAIEFVLCHPNTVLIVTADHETGGVTPDKSNAYGYKFTDTNHTGVEVPIFAIGAGAEALNGKVTDNTEIYKFMAKAFEGKK